MPKRIKRKHRETDDAPGLAGWLFTDLLLGISLVFLATTAFVIIKPSASVNGTATQVTLPCEDFAAFVAEPKQFRYGPGEGQNIGAEIDEYVTTEGLKNGRVAVGIIWGWYDDAASSATTGVQRAKSFYEIFKTSDPDNFTPMSGTTNLSGNMRFIGTKGQTNRVVKDGVLVELFFVYDKCL